MTKLALLCSPALVLTACGGFLGNGDDTTPDTTRPGTDPNVVVLEGAVGNEYLAAEQPGEITARVRVATKPFANAKRPAINLALVVDTSGSMEGEAIDNARDAATAIVDELEPGDQLSVVVFNSVTEVLLPSTALTSGNRGDVKAAIAKMQARGTTDMAGGLTQAIQQAYTGRKDDGVNRIVLLSDGVPNDETQILQLAQNARNSGLAITALGLGVDYNETLLAGIAQTSGGKFHYIDDSAKVAAVFRDEVLRLERVVARNATVTFVPGPGVDILEVVGQQAQPTGVNRQMYVHLGDISEGDEREIVLRLQATGGRPGATIELMDAVLRFQDTVANAGSLERRVYLSAHASDQPQIIEGAFNVDVERSLERARAASAMIQAISMARSGQIEQGQQLLDAAEAEARASAKRFDGDDKLIEQADSMVELRGALPQLAAQPPRPATPDEARAAETAPAVIREAHDAAVDALQ